MSNDVVKLLTPLYIKFMLEVEKNQVRYYYLIWRDNSTHKELSLTLYLRFVTKAKELLLKSNVDYAAAFDKQGHLLPFNHAKAINDFFFDHNRHVCFHVDDNQPVLTFGNSKSTRKQMRDRTTLGDVTKEHNTSFVSFFKQLLKDYNAREFKAQPSSSICIEGFNQAKEHLQPCYLIGTSIQSDLRFLSHHINETTLVRDMENVILFTNQYQSLASISL